MMTIGNHVHNNNHNRGRVIVNAHSSSNSSSSIDVRDDRDIKSVSHSSINSNYTNNTS